MPGTLRGRFVLSHVLPLLLIVPIMGIALVYVVETRVLLPSVGSELKAQAVLAEQVLEGLPAVWTNPDVAQAVAARLSGGADIRVMLISTDGRLLASSRPEDANRVGEGVVGVDIAPALRGDRTVNSHYSTQLGGEIADVMLAVPDEEGQPLGIVRYSYPLTSVLLRFRVLRYLIFGVLVVGLLLGSLVGWVLAANLSGMLGQATAAIEQLADRKDLVLLPTDGPREISRLATAFNALVQRLKDTEESRRHLLANLVHELGRPLGAIGIAVQALETGADQDEAVRKELLAGISLQFKYLQRLLDDLAGLYEYVLGTTKLDMRPVALAEWLPDALAPWREAALAKGLEWHEDIAANLPTLQADSMRLAQVLGNLLSNAIKYTRPGGAVTFIVAKTDGQIRFRVSDTGSGIPADEQAQLFTPFFRGRNQSRFAPGMGLGLAIAREFTAAHGGILSVESTPGTGSTFTAQFPVAPRTLS